MSSTYICANTSTLSSKISDLYRDNLNHVNIPFKVNVWQDCSCTRTFQHGRLWKGINANIQYLKAETANCVITSKCPMNSNTPRTKDIVLFKY